MQRKCAPVRFFLSLIPFVVIFFFALVSSADAQSPTDHSERNRQYFSDLPLVTHEGNPVRFYTDVLEGKVVLVTGFYVNCPSISPRQNLILSRLQKLLGERMGRDVFFITLTIDPQRDTPEKIREYAKVFDPQPGWIFLTGKPENVNWVNYRLGQYVENVESHLGVYHLGNLNTGLWMKASPAAQAEDLLMHLEELLQDKGEASR